MSDYRGGSDLPPDVPPEYADAYRRGYLSAYAQGAPDEAEPEATAPLGRHAAQPSAQPQSQPLDDLLGSHVDTRAPDGRRRWTALAVLIGLAVVLVLVAYLLGRAFSGDVAGSSAASKPTGEASTPKASSDGTSESPAAGTYRGPVRQAAIQDARGSCQSRASVDATGRPVTYPPANVYDQDPTTAWRCDGSAAGETLTITLAGKTPIGQVGVIPGYAKTDPSSGADRYAQNNRVTELRWTFSDGYSVVQRLDGSADNRRLQKMRIPVHRAVSVTLKILRVTPGPRHTTALSTVWLGRTR